MIIFSWSGRKAYHWRFFIAPLLNILLQWPRVVALHVLTYLSPLSLLQQVISPRRWPDPRKKTRPWNCSGVHGILLASLVQMEIIILFSIRLGQVNAWGRKGLGDHDRASEPDDPQRPSSRDMTPIGHVMRISILGNNSAAVQQPIYVDQIPKIPFAIRVSRV